MSEMVSVFYTYTDINASPPPPCSPPSSNNEYQTSVLRKGKSFNFTADGKKLSKNPSIFAEGPELARREDDANVDADCDVVVGNGCR